MAKLSNRKRYQQVRHAAAFRLAGHVAVELAVDHLHFVRAQRAGVFVSLAQAFVVEEVLAPDIRADEGEIGPLDSDFGGEAFLQGPHGALA